MARTERGALCVPLPVGFSVALVSPSPLSLLKQSACTRSVSPFCIYHFTIYTIWLSRLEVRKRSPPPARTLSTVSSLRNSALPWTASVYTGVAHLCSLSLASSFTILYLAGTRVRLAGRRRIGCSILEVAFLLVYGEGIGGWWMDGLAWCRGLWLRRLFRCENYARVFFLLSFC